MNTARKGNAFDVVVQKERERLGWIVGSRRHLAGAGDLIAVCRELNMAWLIECKATKGMYDHFGPEDRADLADLARRHKFVPVLAWRLPGDKIRWAFQEDWPEKGE